MHINHCKRFQEKIVSAGKEALPSDGAIPKQKKSINRMKGHNASSCCPRMTLCHFEVHFGGVTHYFNDPECFFFWLQDRGDASNDDVYLRGALARGEVGSQEVTTFFRKELRLALTLVRCNKGPSSIFVIDVDIDFVRRGQFVRLMRMILQETRRAAKRS